ncbi:MAG TPA: aldehyde dehydrogenase family protein [bacterium]|nr:aldehyde dehydrogenase family protein [bacterium]
MQDYRFSELFEAQKKHFQSHIKSSRPDARIVKLKKIRTWITAHAQDIRDAIYEDFRKPSVEVDLTDIRPVLMEIEHALVHIRSWMASRYVSTPLLFFGTRSKVVYEPKGVCLILAPWNFPFMLSVGPLISAIAAGNCCILKPSEMTPQTSRLIARMIAELFNPNEVCVVEGDHVAAEALLKLPFHHIFFTGSPAIGKKVMHAAAEHLSSVTLELGGKNPVIVDETADIEDTVSKLLWGKFMNGGQSCMAPNYVYVHHTIYTAFCEALVAMYARMFGTANEPSPDVAGLVSDRHYERITSLIRTTVAQGAKTLAGNHFDAARRYVAPTVLGNVTTDHAVMQDEIFGPILPLLRYTHRDEVIAYINTQERPLNLYIFSTDMAKADAIIAQTTAGSTCINETTLNFAHPDLPFGGVNTRGIGKAHGYYGFLAFSNERGILKQRRGLTTMKLVYPPYTERVKKIVKLVMKYL